MSQVRIFFPNESVIVACCTKTLHGEPEVKTRPEEEEEEEVLTAAIEKCFAFPNTVAELYSRVDFDSLLRLVEDRFLVIDAAGGVVQCFDAQEGLKKIAVIKHFQKWDFPKGWVEKGETLEEAAVREVSEECGLDASHVSLENELGVTRHAYVTDLGRRVLKRTHWFLMTCKSSNPLPLLTPQAEEDITECKWVSPTELENQIVLNMFSSLKQIVAKVLLS